MKRNKTGKHLSYALAYDKLILQNKLSVEHMDIIKERVIALDRKNRKLVLIDHAADSKQELCIPLQQIMSNRILEERDENDQSIKKVFLEIELRRDNKRHRFCFYDEARDAITELPSLSRQAFHWRSRININRHPGNVNLEQEFAF